MKKITIETQKPYDVYIGHCLHFIKRYLRKNEQILIITDDIVKQFHIQRLLNEINQPYFLFSLGTHPEANKSLDYYKQCCEYALNHYLNRKLTVIAFGGGAVGDFAAFFASTYKRGVRFISIPTTLLAHDSSVGGKTALNIGGVKNVVGSFYEPEVVLYHIAFLKTLINKEILSGFGEVMKHDLLANFYIMSELINNASSLKELIINETLMEEILYQAILVKKVYIETDLYDQLGKRQYLNFGHTLGHAIEKIYHLSHGEAISYGMVFSLFLSGNTLYQFLLQKLKAWGYFKDLPNFDIEKLIEVMKNDKKNEQQHLKFIGLKAMGQPIEIILTPQEFKERYQVFNQVIK